MTSSVYTYCADAFAQAGNLKNAYTYAGKVFSTAHSALQSCAITFAKKGNSKDALLLAKIVLGDQVYRYCAVAFARIGDHESTNAFLDKINEQNLKEKTNEVVEALSKAECFLNDA